MPRMSPHPFQLLRNALCYMYVHINLSCTRYSLLRCVQDEMLSMGIRAEKTCNDRLQQRGDTKLAPLPIKATKIPREPFVDVEQTLCGTLLPPTDVGT